jgi:hypothetical protein
MSQLGLVATKYSSGVPSRYQVIGLPDRKTAEVGCVTKGEVETWRIRRDRGRFVGAYATAEDALAALQSDIDQPWSQ